MRKFYVASIEEQDGGTANVLFGMPDGTLERLIIEEADAICQDSYRGRLVEVNSLEEFLGNRIMEVVTL